MLVLFSFVAGSLHISFYILFEFPPRASVPVASLFYHVQSASIGSDRAVRSGLNMLARRVLLSVLHWSVLAFLVRVRQFAKCSSGTDDKYATNETRQTSRQTS